MHEATWEEAILFTSSCCTAHNWYCSSAASWSRTTWAKLITFRVFPNFKEFPIPPLAFLCCVSGFHAKRIFPWKQQLFCSLAIFLYFLLTGSVMLGSSPPCICCYGEEEVKRDVWEEGGRIVGSVWQLPLLLWSHLLPVVGFLDIWFFCGFCKPNFLWSC